MKTLDSSDLLPNQTHLSSVLEQSIRNLGDRKAKCPLCGAGADRKDFSESELSKTVYWTLSDTCCPARAQKQYQMRMKHHFETGDLRDLEDAEDILRRANEQHGADTIQAV